MYVLNNGAPLICRPELRFTTMIAGNALNRGSTEVTSCCRGAHCSWEFVLVEWRSFEASAMVVIFQRVCFLPFAAMLWASGAVQELEREGAATLLKNAVLVAQNQRSKLSSAPSPCWSIPRFPTPILPLTTKKFSFAPWWTRISMPLCSLFMSFLMFRCPPMNSVIVFCVTFSGLGCCYESFLQHFLRPISLKFQSFRFLGLDFCSLTYMCCFSIYILGFTQLRA